MELANNQPVAKSVIQKLPTLIKISWVGVGIIVALALYAICRFWIETPDSWDRVLVLVGAAWCAFNEKTRFLASKQLPRPWLGFCFLLLSGIVTIPTWFCYSQIGTRPIILWMLYISAILSVLGILLYFYGWQHVNVMRFILFFAILSLPIPGQINVPLQDFLQTVATSISYNALSLWGFPVHKEGFVLHLPHGQLGVVEACSGVRSLTALTAIAAFLAYLKGFGLIRGTLTVVLAIPVIIFVNSFRIFLTGLIQEYFGVKWVEGMAHEILGFSMIFLGLGLIELITRLIIACSKNVVNPAVQETASNQSANHFQFTKQSSWLCTILISIIVVLAISAYMYPSVARSAVKNGKIDLEKLPMELGEWKAENLEVSQDIHNALQDDRILRRMYRNKLGVQVEVWVIYWSTAKSVKGYHHPDICMPNQGNKILEREPLPLITVKGRTVPITSYEFESGKSKSLLYYWTQEGREFWTDVDEQSAFRFSYPFRWIQKRLGERPSDTVDDKITIQIGTPTWGKGEIGKKAINEVAKRLADSIYDEFTWADPGKR
jgi:EpsI family protein